MFFNKEINNPVSPISPQEKKIKPTDSSLPFPPCLPEETILFEITKRAPLILQGEDNRFWKCLLLMLFRDGAELIKNDYAYKYDPEDFDEIKNLNDFYSNDCHFKLKKAKEKKSYYATIEKQYGELLKYVAANGRDRAPNPLHVLFIITVALDHLRPKLIYSIYKTLIKSAEISGNHPIEFTPECGLLYETGLFVILYHYMSYNKKAFNFIPEAEWEEMSTHSITSERDKRLIIGFSAYTESKEKMSTEPADFAFTRILQLKKNTHQSVKEDIASVSSASSAPSRPSCCIL